jgi:hypothetical protein
MEITQAADDYTDYPPHLRWELIFAFESLPTSAPPPCLGEVLLLDFDGDGEADSRENGWDSTDSFGPGVDENGTTIADFCPMGVAGELSGTRACSRRDFRNDEAQRAKPGDCRVRRDRWCEPREFFFENVPPVSPPRTCLGHLLFDDTDLDGEPDSTDRCPSTPSGSASDGNGCSVEQFCSQQSARLCRRADFRNDEPFAKKPGDCVPTRSTASACAAAAAP